MAHTIREKKKLLARVGRIRGQIEAIERALTEEAECSVVLIGPKSVPMPMRTGPKPGISVRTSAKPLRGS